MICLKENINQFLFYLDNVRGYSPLSIVTYESALRKMEEVSHFHWEEGKSTLDITPFRLKIVNNSKKTISKKLSAIRSFVKYMNEQESISLQLVGDSTIKVPKTLPKPLDKNIIDEILEKSNREERVILILLYGLGLRISELVTLKLENISAQWLTVTGKGNRERNIPLFKQVIDEIERYREYANPQKFLLEKNHQGMTTNQVRYIFSKVFKREGIKATPHQLRHSFATHLLNSGARISDVSELLGHSSMVSTQIYTKLENSKKLNEYKSAHPLCVTK